VGGTACRVAACRVAAMGGTTCRDPAVGGTARRSRLVAAAGDALSHLTSLRCLGERRQGPFLAGRSHSCWVHWAPGGRLWSRAPATLPATLVGGPAPGRRAAGL